MTAVKYTITISDASKDGEVIVFSVQTQTNESEASEQGVVVQRQYDDFEYLLHCLGVKHQMTPIVMPPLPPRPVVLPQDSKEKVSGSIYAGDEYLYDCKRLQRFLQDIADHRFFNEDETLKTFLTEAEAPARAPIKKGILNSLVNMFDSARYLHFKDVDELFQERRDGTSAKLVQTKSCNVVKDKLLDSLSRYSTKYGDLAVICRSSFINLDGSESRMISRFLGQFSEMLDEYKLQNQNVYMITNETVGLCFELYSRYMQACQDMLFVRTCRMVDLDNATRALEKAKPKNKEQLEIAQEEAAKEFERQSAESKTEFEYFSELRIRHFKEYIGEYADRRYKHHANVCATLTKGLNELKTLL